MSVLVCENLSTTLGKECTIKNFNYNFLDNKIYAIIGKNDSCKETLLDLITAKKKPDEGYVYLDGKLLFNNHTVNDRLCYVSNHTTFSASLSIKSIFKLMRNFYPKWDNSYAYELLHSFNISPNTLYGKLNISKKNILHGIIGIATLANITVFANPLHEADMKERYDFFQALYLHHERYPRTIILTTEYIDELDYVVDYILFMDKGKLFEVLETDEIKSTFKYLTGKTEVLKSLISGIKVIGVEEKGKTLTVCIRKNLRKDDIRKFQKYMIDISEVPIQKVFIYLINLRELRGI